MIETRLMAPGRFNIDLVDDTPEHIVSLTARAFSTVMVFPGPSVAVGEIAYDAMIAAASYVGIHMGRPNRRLGFSGYGPAVLLRFARRKTAQTISKRPLYDNSNPSWIRDNVLRVDASETQGLEAGPITVAAASATPKKSGKVDAGQEPLEILGDVCRRFNKEWDVRKGNQLEVGARSDLFVTSPTVVAAPKVIGSDVNLWGLDNVTFDEVDDWDDYATEVVVPFDADDYEFGVAYEVGDTVVGTSGLYYECAAAHTSSGANLPPNGTYWTLRDPYGTATLGSVPYRVGFDGGTAPVIRQVLSARNLSTYDDATDVATNRLNRYDQPQRDVSLDSETFDISGKVRPGDSIYAFSPDHDLYDLTEGVPFAGRVLPAVKIRVQAVREKIHEKQAVVVYSWNGSAFEFTDVTSWVAVESRSPSVVLDLGEPKRRRRPRAVTI